MIPAALTIARLRLSTDAIVVGAVEPTTALRPASSTIPDPRNPWLPAAAPDTPVPSAGVRLTNVSLEALALAPDPDPAHRDSQPAAMLEPVAVERSPDAAPRLALQIADRVEHSGLFYESHLARWADGHRTRESLQREPQNDVRDAMSSPADSARASHLPPNLEPIVREQLAVLERHEVRFALPLGLEQPAELVVSREPQPGQPVSSEPAWNTRLKVTLPALGEVEAFLHCVGQRIAVSLIARDAATAARLADSSAELRSRFGEQLLAISHLEVTHDEPG